MRAAREGLVRHGVGPRRGVRWRGLEVSRLEALTDGVFALAVTLLAVSTEVPASFDALVRTMQGFGSFAAAFATLMLVWYSHYSFFREYGLVDGWITFLNAWLLLVVLFYIYPLKFLFSLLIDRFLLGGVFGLPMGRELTIAPGQIPLLMVVYSTGFLLVFLILALMNARALAKRDALELTPVEVWHTRGTVQAYLLVVAFALTSLVIASLGAPGAVPYAGWIYMLLGPAEGIHSLLFERRGRRRFGAAWEAEGP